MTTSASPTVVRLHGVSKRFLIRENAAHSLKEHALAVVQPSRRERTRELWALRDVSLDIRAGEAVAFMGRNGSGKSSLLRLVAGITTPTTGEVLVRRDARIGTMIELGIGFHGELSARDNVYLNAAIHGLAQEEIDEIYPAVMEYAGLTQFEDQPVKNFSSGMHMRLGFAVAVQLKPDVLLLDEVFAVGDAEFQQRCIRTMQDFLSGGGTLLFVSHEPESVRMMCTRAVLLDAGRVICDATVDEALTTYAQRSSAPISPWLDPDAATGIASRA